MSMKQSEKNSKSWCNTTLTSSTKCAACLPSCMYLYLHIYIVFIIINICFLKNSHLFNMLLKCFKHTKMLESLMKLSYIHARVPEIT